MSASLSITALLVLGRYAYALTDKELIPLAAANDGLTPQQALEGWLEENSPRTRGPIPIVWEPNGDFAMVHDRIDMPRVSRTEFAGSEEVLKKFAAVAHGTHAWGYEPLPKGVARGHVFVHMEGVPGIQLFGETAVSQGIPISAVWSLPTVAFNGYGRGIGVKVLALGPGFCGVYTVPANGGTTRGMVSVVDTTHPDVARSLHPVLEREGFFASDQALKAWRIVGTKEDLVSLGRILASGVGDPHLAEFIANASITAQIKGWPAFIAESTKRLAPGSEADLWATFPQPFPLGKVLRGATIALALVAVVFGIQARTATKEQKAQAITNKSVLDVAQKQLEAAQRDQAIVKRFRAEAAGQSSITGATIPRNRSAILNALHEKVVENYTLTSLVVGPDGTISAEFFQVVDGPESPQELTNLRNELQRSGFSNCNIQPAVSTAADRESGPGLATKQRYHLTAKFTMSSLTP